MLQLSLHTRFISSDVVDINMLKGNIVQSLSAFKWQRLRGFYVWMTLWWEFVNFLWNIASSLSYQSLFSREKTPAFSWSPRFYLLYDSKWVLQSERKHLRIKAFYLLFYFDLCCSYLDVFNLIICYVQSRMRKKTVSNFINQRTVSIYEESCSEWSFGDWIFSFSSLFEWWRPPIFQV